MKCLTVAVARCPVREWCVRRRAAFLLPLSLTCWRCTSLFPSLSTLETARSFLDAGNDISAVWLFLLELSGGASSHLSFAFLWSLHLFSKRRSGVAELPAASLTALSQCGRRQTRCFCKHVVANSYSSPVDTACVYLHSIPSLFFFFFFFNTLFSLLSY